MDSPPGFPGGPCVTSPAVRSMAFHEEVDPHWDHYVSLPAARAADSFAGTGFAMRGRVGSG